MTPVRGLLFVLLLQHARNLFLETAAIQKQHRKNHQRAAFLQKRSFEESSETRFLRTRAA
jgi:hypothetical protein